MTSPFCYKRTEAEIRRANKPQTMRMRIKPLPREKAAIVMLRRRYGYTVTALAEWSGRSTSYIHRVLEKNALLGALKYQNLRRVPHRVRMLAKVRIDKMLRLYGEAWTMWLEGIGEKPP